MKRIYVVEESGMVEYIPASSQHNPNFNITSKTSSNSSSENDLLSIADLTKKFSVSRPTIYAWEKKGLLKRVHIEGRVLFDPNDIKNLITDKKAI